MFRLFKKNKPKEESLDEKVKRYYEYVDYSDLSKEEKCTDLQYAILKIDEIMDIPAVEKYLYGDKEKQNELLTQIVKDIKGKFRNSSVGLSGSPLGWDALSLAPTTGFDIWLLTFMGKLDPDLSTYANTMWKYLSEGIDDALAFLVENRIYNLDYYLTDTVYKGVIDPMDLLSAKKKRYDSQHNDLEDSETKFNDDEIPF